VAENLATSHWNGQEWARNGPIQPRKFHGPFLLTCELAPIRIVFDEYDVKLNNTIIKYKIVCGIDLNLFVQIVMRIISHVIFAERLIQTAGRVIRGPEERGLLAFLDPCFLEPAFARCFPQD